MDLPTARRPDAARSTTPAIRFCAVAKRYRGQAILRQVSFDVAQGTSTALAGINGAGKSTLLRCLLGFCRPDQGRILIQGRDHAQVDARAALGWLPERFVAPAHLNARESLHWLAGLRGGPLEIAQLEATAGDLGLDAQALKTRVRELSKGSSQKLGLLSVCLSSRSIWVLDEPMSGLDAQARRSVARLIDRARNAGRTVLFSTHGLRDLPAFCDQLVVLHDGYVRFCGPPEQLGARYATHDLEAAFLACIEEESQGPVKTQALPVHTAQGCAI